MNASLQSTDMEIEGEILDRAKMSLRDMFQVDRVLTTHGCICCSLWCRKDEVCYSQAGEREYNRTGLCEFCFDAEFDDVSDHKTRIQSHMTSAGQQMMALWVMLSKAKVRAIVTPMTARMLLDIVHDRFARPRLHREQPW